MIETSALLPLLVGLIIAAVIFWLCNWFIGYIGIGDPFAKIIRVILGLVVLVYLINMLLRISGSTPIFR